MLLIIKYIKDKPVYIYITMEQLNIVDLIERNPITKLTDTYNVKLLDKIKSKFSEFEQQLFISSFYCYLNYDKTVDFVIDLDDIWKWLGFSSKQNAIKLLEKHFKVDEDYNNLVLNLVDKHKKGNDGGHNIKKILMNIRCFKSYCLKAGTKKASQIHEYYMKMEETVQEVVDEESTELRLQIIEKDKQIELHKSELRNTDKAKCLLRETTLLSQFHDNIQCIYFGTIDNVSTKKDEPLIKFGCSNFLSDRVKSHKTTYSNFQLYAAYRVCNKTQVENAIKINPILMTHLRLLKLKKVIHKEILSIKTITTDKIDEIIQGIIKNIEFTPENYTKLLEENDILKKELGILKESAPNYYSDIILEYENLKREYQLLQEKNEDEHKIKRTVFLNLVKERNALYNKIAETKPPTPQIESTIIIKRGKRAVKQKDGLFYFTEGAFPILDGTRQDVWDGIAYKTTGGLKKTDLVIGVDGNVVSKIKAISARTDNRIMEYMKRVGKVKDHSHDGNVNMEIVEN